MPPSSVVELHALRDNHLLDDLQHLRRLTRCVLEQKLLRDLLGRLLLVMLRLLLVSRGWLLNVNNVHLLLRVRGDGRLRGGDRSRRWLGNLWLNIAILGMLVFNVGISRGLVVEAHAADRTKVRPCVGVRVLVLTEREFGCKALRAVAALERLLTVLSVDAQNVVISLGVGRELLWAHFARVVENLLTDKALVLVTDVLDGKRFLAETTFECSDSGMLLVLMVVQMVFVKEGLRTVCASERQFFLGRMRFGNVELKSSGGLISLSTCWTHDFVGFAFSSLLLLRLG